MAGPFKIEGKPYTIAVEGKPPVAAAEVTPETAPGKVQAVRTGIWILVLVIGVIVVGGTIAVAVAGLAIYKKKTTT